MPSTIVDLSELTAVAVDDYLLIRDTSDVTNRDKKISVTNLQTNLAQKSGTPVAGNVARWASASSIVDSNVPISDVARLSQSQAFSAMQTNNGGMVNAPTATNVFGAIISMPAGTTMTAIRGQYNSVSAFDFWASATIRALDIYAFDNGSGAGPYIAVRNNNNASTPAAGSIRFFNLNGTQYYVWPDTAALLRIGSTAPTNSTDSGGTVIGAQTSNAAAKYLQDALSPLNEVLERIQAGAAAVRRFSYKSGAFGGQEFEGVVTDIAPAYGMDRDAEHPQGKSLNEIVIMGDLLRAVASLTARLTELEARI